MVSTLVLKKAKISFTKADAYSRDAAQDVIPSQKLSVDLKVFFFDKSLNR